MAGSGRTLLQALDYWAAAQPDKVLHTFLDDRGHPVNALTYSGLLAQSRAVALPSAPDSRPCPTCRAG